MKKNTIYALLALMVVGIVAAAGSVSAFGFGRDTDNREQMDLMLESGDYDSWKEYKESEITEDNFNQRVERHQNRENHRAQRDDMRNAVDSGDYEDYVTAINTMENLPEDFVVMSEDDFNVLVQIHEAKQDGNFDLADDLIDESEIDFPMFGSREGQGRGNMQKGMNQGQNQNGNFVDSDNDGNCDNFGLNMGRGKR